MTTLATDPRATPPMLIKKAVSTGIVRNLSFEEYCERDGLNFSLAKWLLVSPAHYQAALKTETEETIDQTLGKCVHGFILEGKRPEYVIKPEGMHFGRTDGKAWKAAQTKTILTQEEADREVRMCEAIAASAEAARCLRVCPEREVSVFAVYRNVTIKARLDAALLDPTAPAILDLKKCQDASPRGWGNVVAARRYLLQCVWYRAALALALGGDIAPEWAWLVCEDSAAAPVQIYRPTECQLEIGQRQMDSVIEKYKSCTLAGNWPAYFEGEGTFELPRWSVLEQEDAA